MSSGAIALGVARLGLAARPPSCPRCRPPPRSARSRLMQHWEHAFARARARDRPGAASPTTTSAIAGGSCRRGSRCARCSITASCRSSTRTTRSRPRRSSSATTISSRRWSCNLVSADALVILTDVEGVRDAAGVRMPIVRDIDREAAPVAGGSTQRRRLGRHGVEGRLGADRHAHRRAGGRRARPRARRARARARRRRRRHAVRADRRRGCRARKHWIAYGAQAGRARLVVDDGAARALARRRQEPAAGRHRRGRRRVRARRHGRSIVTRDGAEIARGLAAYAADDLRKIQGLQSAAIEATLGYKSIDEAIHRDDLVIL